jgi:uncharacterized protein YecE (DUF72 family)
VILVGTASWTDPTLLEAGWYPKGVARSAEKRLRYYAERFPLVEVDSTYYAVPAERNARLWAERTPRGFRFGVKALSAFTGHGLEVRAVPRDLRPLLPEGALEAGRRLPQSKVPEELVDALWERFASALGPLRDAGKLLYVLFQFPPWFRPGEGSLERLKEVSTRARSAGLAPAVEFRHASWYRDEVWPEVRALMREWELAHVAVDAPRVRGAPPTVLEATRDDLAVLRCHGRNAETWWRRSEAAYERFNYWYSEEEVREHVAWARALEGRARTVAVVYNNNFRTQGVEAAAAFMRLVGVKWPHSSTQG